MIHLILPNRLAHFYIKHSFSFFLLLICFFLELPLVSANAATENKTINISNQNQFDTLRQNIKNIFDRANNPVRLLVNFKNTAANNGYTIYYYNDGNNLFWEGRNGIINWQNHRLIINCESNVYLIATTQTREQLDSVSWQNGSMYYVNGKPYNYDRWTQFTKSDSICSVTGTIPHNDSIATYRLNIPQSEYDSNSTHVQITEWYKSQVYPIANYSGGNLLFCNVDTSYYEMHDNQQILFPNFDYYQSQRKMKPRYRFVKHPSNVNNKRIYYCIAPSFINITNVKLDSLIVQNTWFFCNKRRKDRDLLRLTNVSMNGLLIENCKFNAIRGNVIYLDRVNNATIKNNRFQDCYESCVVSNNGGNKTKVLNNIFDHCGLGMKDNFCISCSGENFLIKGNRITNFTYSAIGVGLDRDKAKIGRISGIVENNTIDNFNFCSSDSIMQKTLMDIGAIYTWGQNDDVVIQNNSISNYGGVHQYRGIFCDQGTKNVTIIKNTIKNIKNNSWGLSQNYIELDWREDSHQRFSDHNSGNYIYDNYFDTDAAEFEFQIKYDYHATTINVSSSNFSNLSNLINDSINSGNDFIVVNLQQNATYEFKDKHISLSNINRPVSLKIVGHNTTLVPVTSQYTSLDFLSFDSIAAKKPWMQHDFGANHSEVSSNWGNWAFATGLITRTNISRTDHRVTYSIATGNTSLNVSEYDCKGYYIQLTSWYTSQVLPITKIERGVIHFTSLTSEPLSLTNEDYTHSNNQLKPRYRIYHINYSHQYSKASTLLSIEDCTLAKVELSGINVKGNDGKRPLINLDSIKSAGIHISDCNFENIHGTVILAQKTSDLVVSDCTFRDCLGDGISSRNGCIRTKVENNEFYNQGGNMTQSFAIDCRGRNFLVQNNKIENFCFGGIAVGLWRGYNPIDSISGTVRNNNIYFTDSHVGYYQFKTLMGGGAIYAWKQSDRVVITKNTIRNIRGLIGYKAIVGEVGARNLRITDNTINNLRPDWLGVKNYSIDLPWDSSDAIGFNRNNHQSGNVYIYGGASSVITSASGNDYIVITDKLRFEGRAPSSNMSLSPLQESDSEQDTDIHSEQNAPDDDNTTSPYYYNLNGNITNVPKHGFSINVGTSTDRSTNKTSLLR